jgi:tRNA A-37 threonylcarbamoyl transferase component Bud32
LKAPQVVDSTQKKTWTDREGRLGNEVAALQFLEESAVRCVPRIIGVDLKMGIIVLEEIVYRGRLDGLLGGSVKVQGGFSTSIEKFALALAQIHSATSGAQLASYAAAREAIGLANKAPPDAKSVRALLTGVIDEIAELKEGELDREGFVREMEAAFRSSFAADGGEFSALIHADLCPDNVLILNKRGDVCILDFEFSRGGNALMDISFLRLGFPTCWCVGMLPRELVKRAEQMYREAVGKTMPEMLDKQKWRNGMAQCCALWTWGFIRSSIEKGVLKEDLPLSKTIEKSPTRRQMILRRLQVTAKAVGKNPEMKNVYLGTMQLYEALKTRWEGMEEIDKWS